MDRRIAIVDYGMGNLSSVRNAFAFLGYRAAITSDPSELKAADACVLPGVGAFGEAMNNLASLELVDVLRAEVMEKKKPFLGICLGMQLLAEDSREFGHHEGLGWIEGHVRHVQPGEDLRLPHVGWNSLEIREESTLFAGIEENSHYYFDHSLQLDCPPEHVTAVCEYGNGITASICVDNIFATQFHPEKSQVMGLKLLRNFTNYVEARYLLGAEYA